MKWRASETALANARARLPKLAEKYFESGRETLHKKENPKQLHRFRIETKRFRYALEIFRPLYGPSLDRHLQSLRGIQDALGKINDYETIHELIAGDKQLEVQIRKVQRKKIKEFRQEWKKFDSNGQLARWRAFLSRARQPAKKRSPARPSDQN